jgi:RimJ/RimL family protein N-acetyltransferase
MARVVETQRLRLEPWDRRAHAPGLVELNSDAEVMRFITGGALMTRVESQMQSDRIAEHWRTYGFGLWAAIEAVSGRMLGFAGLAHPLWLPGWDRSVEVGWRFARHAWGNGYATEAGLAGLRYGFEQLRLREIISLIHPENERSLAVAGRLGMASRDRVPHPHRPHDLEIYAVAPPEG